MESVCETAQNVISDMSTAQLMWAKISNASIASDQELEGCERALAVKHCKYALVPESRPCESKRLAAEIHIPKPEVWLRENGDSSSDGQSWQVNLTLSYNHMSITEVGDET